MKKLIVSLACLTLIGMSYAKDEHGWMVSLKQGYFVPQAKVLRDIFSLSGSKGGYFVEGALRFNVWDELYLELNGSYFGRKGRALIIPTSTNGSCQESCGCGECVNVKIPTVGFGVKYYYWFRDYASVFVGGGIKGFFVRIHNDSPYVSSCDNKNAVGGFVHTGLLFDVYKGLFFELFADYLGTRLKYPCADTSSVQYKLNVGGFAGGVGIGYKF